MTRTTLRTETLWDRPAIVPQNGAATLLIRIVAPDAPANASTERPPVDLAFVIDRSGSMSGRPVELAKQAVSHAAGMLDRRDRAALVAFDTRVDLLQRLVALDSRQRSDLRMTLAGIQANGGTDLCAGWLTGCRELAYQPATGGSDRVRRAILLTDGQANHGEISPTAICAHASELRRHGITTTTLGMGHGFDEELLSAMAEAGGGNFAYVDSPAQLARTFERELDRLTSITATNINLRLRLPEGLYGELLSPFPVERTGRRFDIAIDDLSANDEVVLIFLVTGRDLMRESRLPVELSVRWTATAGNERRTEEIDVSSISVVEERIYDGMPRSDEVATQGALLRASIDQRRAMELDRAGRYAESRKLLFDAHDLLLSAPDSDEVLHRRVEAERYTLNDASAPLTEHTRKQAVHNSLSRSRRRQPVDPTQ